MKSKSGNFGRANLVNKLRASGLSRRQAVAVVNVILEWMILALRRGRKVGFPFGKLRRVERYFNRHWEAAGDWPADRDRYTIEYVMTEAGRRELSGEVPAGASNRRPKGGK